MTFFYCFSHFYTLIRFWRRLWSVTPFFGDGFLDFSGRRFGFGADFFGNICTFFHWFQIGDQFGDVFALFFRCKFAGFLRHLKKSTFYMQ